MVLGSTQRFRVWKPVTRMKEERRHIVETCITVRNKPLTWPKNSGSMVVVLVVVVLVLFLLLSSWESTKTHSQRTQFKAYHLRFYLH